MSLLFFDCFSGISGDMIIGALLDLGMPLESLQSSLEKLSIPINISCTRRNDKGLSGLSFQVNVVDSSPLRHLSQIEELIYNSSLDVDIKERSLVVFNRLAEAEGTVHGISPHEVHFHEIGAVDTLIDVIGTFICLKHLGVEKAYCSPLPWTRGWVDIDHGRFPLPSPATSYLISGFPCVYDETNLELVTPTGAALITSIAHPGPPPAPFVPTKIGYGAGNMIRADNIPNLLRVIKADAVSTAYSLEEIAVLETEVDDLNPEVFSYLHNLLVNDPSVLDYFVTSVLMKKNRPGALITILTKPVSIRHLTNVLMRETGSLGIRYRIQNRLTADRETRKIQTPWGMVRVKVATLDSGKTHLKPEAEDCQAIAAEYNLPLSDVLTTVNCMAFEAILKKSFT